MIRALIMDVDGVLTDGGIILDASGEESKRFHARDGVGIRLAQNAGWAVLFLTARGSGAAKHRAQELGAEWAIGIRNKESFLEAWLERKGIDWEDAAFIADDLPDLKSLRRVGWPVAVADAAAEVREAAKHVTDLPGGNGAVREAVEWLLDRNDQRKSAVVSLLDGEKGFSVGDREDGTGHD